MNVLTVTFEQLNASLLNNKYLTDPKHSNVKTQHYS